MSRYVEVILALRSLDEVADGLGQLGIAFERGTDRLMLAGSLECAGQPVDLRLRAGTLDAVEDFGVIRDDETGDIKLVCGEPDEDLLQEKLLAPLRTHIAAQRVKRSAARTNMVVHSDTVDPTTGARKIVIRQKS